MITVDLDKVEKTLLEGTLKMMLDVLDQHTTRIQRLETRMSEVEAIIKGR